MRVGRETGEDFILETNKRDCPTVKSSKTESFFKAGNLSYQCWVLKSWQLVTWCIDSIETLVSLGLYLYPKYPMKRQRQQLVVYCSLRGKNTSKHLLFLRTILYKELILISREVCVLWRIKMIVFSTKTRPTPNDFLFSQLLMMEQSLTSLFLDKFLLREGILLWSSNIWG